MEKLDTHGDKIGRITLHPLISDMYVIQWCYKEENLNALGRIQIYQPRLTPNLTRYGKITTRAR